MTENSTAVVALDPKCAAFICSDIAQGGREAIARFSGGERSGVAIWRSGEAIRTKAIAP